MPVAELSTHSHQQDPGQVARVAAGQGDELSGPRRPCPGTRFFVVTTTENKGPPLPTGALRAGLGPQA